MFCAPRCTLELVLSPILRKSHEFKRIVEIRQLLNVESKILFMQKGEMKLHCFQLG